MERFNSKEEPKLTPLQIAKELVFSDDYNDRRNLVKLIAKEIEDAYDKGYGEGYHEGASDMISQL